MGYCSGESLARASARTSPGVFPSNRACIRSVPILHNLHLCLVPVGHGLDEHKPCKALPHIHPLLIDCRLRHFLRAEGLCVAVQLWRFRALVVNQPLGRLVNQPHHAVRPFSHGPVGLLQNPLQLHHIPLGIGAPDELPRRRFHAAPGVHRAVRDLPLQLHQLLEVTNRLPQLRILLLQNLVHLHRIRVTVGVANIRILPVKGSDVVRCGLHLFRVQCDICVCTPSKAALVLLDDYAVITVCFQVFCNRLLAAGLDLPGLHFPFINNVILSAEQLVKLFIII